MWQTVSNLFAFKSRRVTPDAAVMRGSPPPAVAVFSEFFQTHSLADLLNCYAYHPETKLYHNVLNAPFIDPKARPKSYGFILEIQTPAGASDEMARVLLGLFNQQYVTGATLQFCLWASPEISPLLNHWIAARKPGSIYERMARRRAEYLSTGVRKSLFKDSPYLLRNFRATLAVFMPGEANDHDVVDALSLRDGLTGVLMRHAGQFLQAIEGSRGDVDRLLKRLRADPRHENLRLLSDHDVPERLFAAWPMTLAEMTPDAARLLNGAPLDQLSPERAQTLLRTAVQALPLPA